jgi:hypothetical protein
VTAHAIVDGAGVVAALELGACAPGG